MSEVTFRMKILDMTAAKPEAKEMSCPQKTSRRFFPLTVEKVPDEEEKLLQAKGFLGYTNLVRTNPSLVLLRPAYADLAESYYNFEFRPDDTVLLTFPKSGTTWLSEALWALRNLDQLGKADEADVDERLFFMDSDFLQPGPVGADTPAMKKFSAACPEGRVEDGVTLQVAAAQKGPRILKSHLQLELLNPELLDTCKVVYMARNPKDVCVSYFHHCRKNTKKIFQGEFSDFAEAFMGNKLLFAPYWDHVRQVWLRRGHENLHFMFFEHMKKDVFGELKRLATFLKAELSDEDLQRVADHCSFGRMREREERQSQGRGPSTASPASSTRARSEAGRPSLRRI
ncbi:LOW QUALITY PROTEIN: sulfotransferase family cytosolic 1B member 1-like [Penaeus monodon]|uniref:LOW QUALITY PROTEIN: sulfotransferase family cytosolic 1B member 1-like n=1 Tax=Penaeus monodon TaxID=6687 RepID=UPI0018A71089|nr:LOW QUALITY PROTEIN: sulfotransferase family cytosolic 1B member 1-like [Penaeus monodon]